MHGLAVIRGWRLYGFGGFGWFGGAKPPKCSLISREYSLNVPPTRFNPCRSHYTGLASRSCPNFPFMLYFQQLLKLQ
jgi:hypothetical protein